MAMWAILTRLKNALERIDPGAHRRIKGLRLVSAYGMAEALGSLDCVSADVHAGLSIGALAGNFALWASVSEARATRGASSRDLAALCLAGALGAASFALLSPWLRPYGCAWPEIILVVGAFLAGYLKRYGATGAGLGSQIYIGQLLACNAKLAPASLHMIGAAMLVAMISALVPRLLSGPAEQPALASSPCCMAPRPRGLNPELVMGFQAGIASLIIVTLDVTFGLVEAVWAITACVYVIAGTASGTRHRVRHRIVGTLVGVPLGLLCLPLATNEPLLLWCAASLAMVIYAMALPDRYDVACAAFAFVLMVTLAVSGERSAPVLIARTWETILGSAIALVAASLLFPLRAVHECVQPSAPAFPFAKSDDCRK
jgi:hypothetical protein